MQWPKGPESVLKVLWYHNLQRADEDGILLHGSFLKPDFVDIINGKQ